MNSTGIKIFYSWQSDLPGNQTRSVIQESIESVVKSMKDTVEIIADRDTKGEYGSPDIVETIFKKIDECDIFIADVSIINRYYAIDEEGKPIEAIKTTPNPNVLLELGYAAHVLGWENIICILNTDFGKIEELPFDIRQRRLTPFSLENKKKSEVRKMLREIIASTVMNIQENGTRPKGSSSNHVVGAYDFETKNIVKKLIPYEVANSEWYIKERKKILNKCKELINNITEIKIQPIKEIEEPIESTEVENTKIIDKEMKLPINLKNLDFNNDLLKKITKFNPVMVKEEDRISITKNTKKWFNIDLSEDFFYLGGLQTKFDFLNKTNEYSGTEKEKNKHEKIEYLQYYMSEVEILDLYIETFKGLYLFPLAIFNSSNQADKNITVSVKINDDSADIISPTKELIYEEIVGLEGIIYESETIKDLLIMPESTDIFYDKDITYDINDSLHQMRKTPVSIIGSSMPQYDSDDYERELKKYIVSPIDIDNSEVEFYVNDLRPKEKKWLSGSILVKPKARKISFSYFIKSNNSSGELSGVIEYEI